MQDLALQNHETIMNHNDHGTLQNLRSSKFEAKQIEVSCTDKYWYITMVFT